MGLLRRRHKLRIGLWEAPERDECFFDIVGESFHADEIRKLIDAAGPLVKQYGEWRKLGCSVLFGSRTGEPTRLQRNSGVDWLRGELQPTNSHQGRSH